MRTLPAILLGLKHLHGAVHANPVGSPQLSLINWLQDPESVRDEADGSNMEFEDEPFEKPRFDLKYVDSEFKAAEAKALSKATATPTAPVQSVTTASSSGQTEIASSTAAAFGGAFKLFRRAQSIADAISSVFPAGSPTNDRVAQMGNVITAGVDLVISDFNLENDVTNAGNDVVGAGGVNKRDELESEVTDTDYAILDALEKEMDDEYDTGDLQKRQNQGFADFVGTLTDLNINQMTMVELQTLFKSQMISSHIEEIVKMAVWTIEKRTSQVTACAVLQFGLWLNASWANTSGTFNIPITNADGTRGLKPISVGAGLTLPDPLSSNNNKRKGKRASGNDPVGDADPSNVIDGGMSLATAMMMDAERGVAALLAANEHLPGMTRDARIAFQAYVETATSMAVQKLYSDNQTEINASILRDQINNAISIIDSQVNSRLDIARAGADVVVTVNNTVTATASPVTVGAKVKRTDAPSPTSPPATKVIPTAKPDMEKRYPLLFPQKTRTTTLLTTVTVTPDGELVVEEPAAEKTPAPESTGTIEKRSQFIQLALFHANLL